MNKILLIIIASIVLTSCEKENISIIGHLNGIPNDVEIELFDISAKEKIAVAETNDGSFELNGDLIDSIPNMYWLKINDPKKPKIVNLMLEPNENISIQGSARDFPNNLIIKNSKHSGQFYAYHNETKSLDDKREILLNKFFELKDKKADNDSLFWGTNGSITMLDKEHEQKTKEYIRKNYTTYFGLYTLSKYFQSFSKEELKSIYNNLPPTLQKSRYGKLVYTYASNRPLVIGSKFRDFTAVDAKNKIQNFSSLINNRFTILSFSTLHCQPSLKSQELLKKLVITHPNKLSVVTYYVDADEAGFDYLSKESTSNWTFLRNVEGRFSPVYAQYEITSTPTFYIFKDGVLIKKISGFESGITEQEIEKLLL